MSSSSVLEIQCRWETTFKHSFNEINFQILTSCRNLNDPVVNTLLYGYSGMQCRFLVSLMFSQDFEEACFLLVKTGALQVTQQEVLVTERGHRTLTFLTSMLDPFLQGYQVRETCTLFTLNKKPTDTCQHLASFFSGKRDKNLQCRKPPGGAVNTLWI